MLDYALFYVTGFLGWKSSATSSMSTTSSLEMWCCFLGGSFCKTTFIVRVLGFHMLYVHRVDAACFACGPVTTYIQSGALYNIYLCWTDFCRDARLLEAVVDGLAGYALGTG